MGLPEKLLGDGEHEVLHLRTHPKVMVVPGLMLLATVAIVIVLIMVLPPAWQPWSVYIVSLAAVVVLIAGFVVPLLRWRTTTYTVTNHRLITRQGLITKTGQDLPLHSISNVAYERSLLDRAFGCGTLVFTTSAEAPVVLHDIPDVEACGVEISELLTNNRRAET